MATGFQAEIKKLSYTYLEEQSRIGKVKLAKRNKSQIDSIVSNDDSLYRFRVCSKTVFCGSDTVISPQNVGTHTFDSKFLKNDHTNF
ncbi:MULTISPECIES: hypothetical protein [Leptospira]|uniref:Uncharacterized protein n=4 Tax=Leptospira borgpetersenii TaxID=174 RepID=M3HQ19_LEPBO|nr:hypothetical protein [Leptospira borgpetersenii]AXX14542.1 hypothetical protein C4Q31_02180 [Leptospira borgpetersenii serovar Ceylonica]EMF99759.1 hypothetical protein LEP1GSC123_0071 [Leptospira borgpetersenii str. 200701203]EMK11750.1 hypothetical protein LEP1GSC066_0270 [Leptospira sp. serovar Kenya str. Sh9]EMO08913.1 hypothetical protein LEP1GSC137_0754 [Leptospira borgpetersenii str. Noumea 25]EKP13310.1 hypothetical protein LEP1GSC128_3117 [Leptospira borgpetersenii str. 200801926]